MSLFRSSVRPSAVVSDAAVERYLAALRLQIDPDPAFRRRLRGIVMNRYVAAREFGEPAVRSDALRLRPPKVMGRMGRAVLYASFALGISVTGTMAASGVAVPGDALYSLKRAIEDLRVQVLPPAFHENLAVHELSERVAELATLTERGDEARATALAHEITTEYVASAPPGDVAGAVADERHQALLTSLIDRLPREARAAVANALAATGGPGAAWSGAGAASPDDNGQGGGPGGNVGTGAGGPHSAPDASGAGDGSTSEGNRGNGSGGAGNGSGGAGNGSGGGGNGPPDGASGPAAQPDPGPSPIDAGRSAEPAPTASADLTETPKPKKTPKP